MTLKKTLAAALLAPYVFLIAFLTSPVFAQDSMRVYDPADPQIGYNLISFASNNPNELDEYIKAIDELVATDARHVNLAVFRQVDVDGKIDFGSGPGLWTIFMAAQHAKANNLKVTITPIFETQEESSWRGDWNPTGSARLNFTRHYAFWLFQLAFVASRTDTDKLMIGSELVAFANDPGNRQYLDFIVWACGSLFSGELGYNANWDNVESPSVKEIFWNHPRITALSVSMYPYNRLASLEEADQSQLDPEAFAEMVKQRWKKIIIDELLTYAEGLDNGEGMPVLIGEFGAVPYNRCAFSPAAVEPSTELDPKEQEAVIMGLIHSVDQLRDRIPEVTIWQWGIGDVSDRFGLNPFHESPQQSTALAIHNFVKTSKMLSVSVSDDSEVIDHGYDKSNLLAQ